MGVAQKEIADAFPEMMVVETGVGYGGSFAKFRVWESYAWMHTCLGAWTNSAPHDADGRWFDAVIPGYLEPEAFPLSAERGSTLLYVGRMIERKGIHTAVQIAAACRRQLVMAGPGQAPEGVISLGEIGPEARSERMGEARALLAPTTYIEPFGNVAIEAMACGTPVISTDWGAFTETVVPGVTGYRCRSLQEFVDAVKLVGMLDPVTIREHALARYSLDVIGAKYEEYFLRLSTLWDKGWTQLRA